MGDAIDAYDDRDGVRCTIRPAALDDLGAVAAIYNRYLGRATFDLRPKDAAHFARLLERFAEEGRQTLVVLEREESVIGWGLIKRYSDREAYDQACETSVFLAEAFLRRGHGSRLKRVLLAECRRLGYHHVVAKTVAENTAAIRYNEALGYEVVGVQREIGLVDGRRVDVCILQRLL